MGILHSKDNGEELGSKDQNKLRKFNSLRMGRKKKEKDPSAAEDKLKEEKEGDEAEVESEKRAGRRSSKPVVAKWAIVMDDSSSSEEDPEICPICEDKNDPTKPEDQKNRMIGCDGCDKWYHWNCVGIDRNNKPGKEDDWFCKKCKKQKKEAGEWKPSQDQQHKVEIIPARENAQNHRTLAQKKEYDAPLEERVTKKKGRSVEKKAKRAPQESSSRTPTPDLAKKPKESWVTGTPSNVQKPGPQLSALPPGIVVGRSTEDSSGESSPQYQVQERIANLGGISLTPSRSNGEESRTPLLPSLPPGMSISREALPPKLPPGVSLQPSTLSKLPPGISIEADDHSPVPTLPPGISMEKAREEEKAKSPREEVSREDEHSSEEESRTRSPRRAKASISYQELPLNKKMRQGDNSQTLISGKTLPELSIEKSREDTLKLNLPPGMMISKSVNEKKIVQSPAPGNIGVVDQGEESSSDDNHPEDAGNLLGKKKISLKKKRGTPRTSPDKFIPPPENGSRPPPPQQERVKSQSPEPKEPRAARGRSELARAKIRATLREDSLSDEEQVGARVPYRKGRWKDDGIKSKVTLPAEAELETKASSKINRKAWQALGEPSEEKNLGKDLAIPDESNVRESL